MVSIVTEEDNFLRATRSSYNAVAPSYLARFGTELDAKPLDRALLGAFAEIVRDRLGGGPVADMGCGPGHITAYLTALGLDTVGIDLSDKMVDLARRTYPGVRFDQGSMTSLGLSDRSLSAIVAFYSIIHIPDGHLPMVFADFHRVLRPDGVLLLSFQVGDEERHLTEWHGHEVDMYAYLRRPEAVVRWLEEAGLAVSLQLVREPEPTETLDRCYLMARRGDGR